MRFYVYDLVDPRDGQTFYVGKGQKNRVEAHEAEAGRGGASPKSERIRAIWAAGLSVERRIVARFAEEAKAYEYEAARIEEIGLGNLTNLIPGGGGCQSVAPFWNERTLKKAAPILARALIYLKLNKKAMLGTLDITPAIMTFIHSTIDRMGFEAVAGAVAPHGVKLEKLTDNSSGARWA